MKKLILFCFLISSVFANEKVTLQLKWFHQFQFAGYYAAKEKGFYEELGLDVTIKQRDIKQNNIEQVIRGESQYGVADSILFKYGAQNKPITIVSTIFQHTPNVIITLKGKGYDTPYTLKDKTIRHYKKSTDGFVIDAMFNSMYIEPKFVEKTGFTDYKLLIDGKIDALSGYITNEPFYFKEKNIDINLINPANYGFDFYGDMLFANLDEVRNHPNRVKRFKEATLKGWRYALDNKEEIINLIKTKYAKNKSIEHLRYEAQALEQLIQHKSIPLGTIDKGRIKYILDLYKKYGFIEDTQLLDDFLFEGESKKIELTKQELEWFENNKNIKLSIVHNQKPVSILKEDGSIDGIVNDYIKYIKSMLPIDINISLETNKDKQDFHEMATQDGFYGTASIFNNPKNYRDYYVTQPYMYINFVIFTNRDKSSNINNKKDLEGKKIAVLKSHRAIYDYLKDIKGIQIVEVETLVEQLNLLQYKQVDAIGGYTTYHYIINEYLLTNIVPAYSDTKQYLIGMGINKDSKILYDVIQRAFKNIPYYEKQKIISKWISEYDIDSILTFEEKQYLENKKEITMCIDPNWMPFEKNDNGVHIGMSADYIKILQKYIPIPIKLVPTKSWSESLEYGKQRKCDIFSLVMPTKERRTYLNFTKPYIKVPLVIVTKSQEPFINDVSKITNKKLAVIKNYAYVELLKEKYPQLKLVYVSNVKEGLQKVQNGEYFGFIGTIATTGYEIQKHYVGHIKIAGKFDESWDLGIATRNDEILLNDIFNKAIEKVTSSEHQQILNKWVSVKYDSKLDLEELLKWVFIVVLLSIIVILIILKRNKRVQIELDEKKRIEKELLDLQTQLSEAQKLAHLGSWKLDLKTDKMLWSNETFRILGEEPQTFTPSMNKLLKYIPKDEHHYITKTIEHSVKEKTNFEIEHKVIRDDGETVYVKQAGSTTFDENGEGLYIVSSILDMTLIKLHEIQEETRLAKITNYQNALLELSKVDYQNLKDAVCLSTEVTAKTLNVDRVGIWLFSDDKKSLEAITLYSFIDNKHTNGGVLKQEDFPYYFNELKDANSIVSNDVINDKLALNLKDNYLIPNNICSILYNPIVSNGEVLGVICIEHTFINKQWSAEDMEFALAISNTISLAFEIENRKIVEKELEDTLELFNLGETSLFKWKNDERWSIEYVSANVKNVLGYSIDEFMSEDIIYSSIIHEDDITRVINEVSENLDKESFIHEPYRVKKSTGEYIWVMDKTKIIRDQDNQPCHFLGHIRDITHEVNQKNELEISNINLVKNEKLAALGQLVANIAHEINSPLGAINSSIESSSTELISFINSYSTLLESLNDDEKVLVFEIIHRLIDNQGFVSSSQERAYKKQLIPILKDLDIESSRALADKLVRLKIYDKEYVEFILPILRSQNSKEILDILLKVGKLFSNNYNIQEAIKASTKTILALKSYSHSMDGKGSETTKKIKESIDTVLTIYHNKIKYAVVLEYDYIDLAPIKANHDELTQVWTNLIHNALYAMDNKGTLSIKLYEDEKYQIVEVKDSGCGMSEEVKSRIFEPFFTTKPTGVGSGLGLDIIKNIIEKHGGKIEVESEVDIGSTFVVKLLK